jgi:hypothetical protein
MSPLGIPPGSAKSAVKAVRSHLEAAGWQAEFEAAIDALAGMLGSTATRTGYGRRRPALRNWAISPGQRNQLTAGLPQFHGMAGALAFLLAGPTCP